VQSGPQIELIQTMSDEHDDDATRPKGPRSPHYKANNAGGYGNPPVRGQFRKDNPGGPGRPKGITNVEAALRKRFATKLPVGKDGKSVKMTPQEIFAERVVEAILNRTTSPAMLEYALGLFKRFGSPEPQDQPMVNWSSFSDDEFRLLSGLLERALGDEPAEDYVSPLGPQYNRTVEGYYCATRRPDGHIVIEKVEEAKAQLALPSPPTM
jgi:hypothetical protein